MKIKKSNVNFVVGWVENQLAKDNDFPFEKGEDKTAKKHLKALKSWRKCTHSPQEIGQWCEEWLSEKYSSKLEKALSSSKAHKANQEVRLTKEAFDKLVDISSRESLSLSEVLIKYLKP